MTSFVITVNDSTIRHLEFIFVRENFVKVYKRIKTVAKPLLTKKHNARENLNPKQTIVCKDFKFMTRK